MNLFSLGINMFGFGSTQSAPETRGVGSGPVRMDPDLIVNWPNLEEKICLALQKAENKESSLSDRVSSYSEACNHLASLVKQIYDRAFEEKKSWEDGHCQILRTQKQTTQNTRDEIAENLQTKVNTTLATLMSELRRHEKKYPSLEICSEEIFKELETMDEVENNPIAEMYWDADTVRLDAEKMISRTLLAIDNLKVIRTGSRIEIT